MYSRVLTPQQKHFLALFGGQKVLVERFYLTGGTALAGFYIPYRVSDDLDFFSENEIDMEDLLVFLKTIKKELGFGSFETNTSFNRNLVFLKFHKGYELKVEFTYFPFPQIKRSKQGKVRVDSIIDIAVNKLFTIYQNPRSRDFMDLYMINGKYCFTFEELKKRARVKFDWHIDPLKLGSQLLLARELKDYPRLLVNLKEEEWQGYFLEQARKLGTQILG